jgi:hypothetical protein
MPPWDMQGKLMPKMIKKWFVFSIVQCVFYLVFLSTLAVMACTRGCRFSVQ